MKLRLLFEVVVVAEVDPVEPLEKYPDQRMSRLIDLVVVELGTSP